MTKVLILRSPSPSDDAYEKAFSSAGYNPHSIPVLETVFVNQNELRNVILENSDDQFDGVVVTSARAVEAWGHVLSQSNDGKRDWSSIPFYVVGKGTSSAIRSLSASYPSSKSIPKITRGESSGTSEALAHYIVSELSRKHGRKRLLYLTGDKNRDTLTSIIDHADLGLELVPMQVYETRGSSTFEKDLEIIVNHTPYRDPWWIVFFAPSSADFTMPYLRNYFEIPSSDAPSTGKREARVAAIGPTTSSHLTDTLNTSVDVVAVKPNAESLVSSIKEAEG